ncbi:MAG TPA: HAMP domain-containing sensor histidine kinase [Dissulfurispiraceae bacterium]|nr:HAMP domain-containing sensor histidine kinase [Dissulfurispiraceae bacterium]
MNKRQHRGVLTPFRITLIYAIFGSIWIVLSDTLVAEITSNALEITLISIAKGWLYVFVTSLLLYWMIRHFSISRKKAMEAEIAKEAAEAANKAKSDFLANMSHELRTPLNSIIGFSEIMRDGSAGKISERQKEFVDHIYESGSHLLSLINDVLDLSKIEAGRMELNFNRFLVKDLMDSGLSLFKEKALKRNIKITAETEEDFGTIVADLRLLKQVLFNLAGNAVKFTPDGGSIRLKVRRFNSGFLEFSVADTGIGISTEDKGKLFQPFQQLDNSYNRKYPGTGLGLSICKRIVELHGGKIWVESEPGKGSKFIFIVPHVKISQETKGTGENI